MSTNLHWEPAKKPIKSLPKDLKFKLEERFGVDAFPMVVDDKFIDYLTALAQCHVEGATYLMNLIDKYKEVKLSIL